MKYRTVAVFTTTYRWVVEANSESEAHDKLADMLACHYADDFMICESDDIDIYVDEVDDEYSVEIGG